MEHKFINELKQAENISSDYLIENFAVRKKKNGEDYWDLILTDRSGSIPARIWDNLESIEPLNKGDFILVEAQVGSFNNKLQLTVAKVKKMAESQCNLENYLKKTKKNIDQLFVTLLEHIDNLKNPYLKKMLKMFFVEDPDFAREFKKVPAGKTMHNAYIGGLLEHVVAMLALADFVCQQYQGIDQDLLKTGVIIHDIGKLRELEYGITLDYSDEGKLIGHHVIGITMINEKIKQIPDFPKDQKMLLEHMILSHHGRPEWGSPKTPATLEAVILHYLDNIDAKITGFQQFVENNPPEDNWTKKAFMFENSSLFIGNQNNFL